MQCLSWRRVRHRGTIKVDGANLGLRELYKTPALLCSARGCRKAQASPRAAHKRAHSYRRCVLVLPRTCRIVLFSIWQEHVTSALHRFHAEQSENACPVRYREIVMSGQESLLKSEPLRHTERLLSDPS